MDAITSYLDMGTYSEWDEEKKLEFLSLLLDRLRVVPLFETVKDLRGAGSVKRKLLPIELVERTRLKEPN